MGKIIDRTRARQKAARRRRQFAPGAYAYVVSTPCSDYLGAKIALYVILLASVLMWLW